MRYPEAKEVVTYKCEGCGVRKPDGTQLVTARFPDDYTVCSLACYREAVQQYERQRYDHRILALVRNYVKR